MSIQLKLQAREIILQDSNFNKWYNTIPIVRQITEKKALIREKIEQINQQKYRQKMSNLSNIKSFFNQHHGKKAKVLKDLNFTDSSLFKWEEITINKDDSDLIQEFAFKIGKNDIKEYLMILGK